MRKIHSLKIKSVRVGHKYLCYPKFLDDNDLRIIRWLYAASAYYMDYRLASLFKWAEKEGYLKNAIWIITSDHGQLLGEHGRIYHGTFLDDELLRIPLLIKYPKHVSNTILKEKYEKYTDNHVKYAFEIDGLAMPIPGTYPLPLEIEKRLKSANIDELELDRKLYEESFKFMAENLKEVLSLSIIKFKYL